MTVEVEEDVTGKIVDVVENPEEHGLDHIVPLVGFEDQGSGFLLPKLSCGLRVGSQVCTSIHGPSPRGQFSFRAR